MDGVSIQLVEEHRFLGLVVDNRLRFQAHIDALCRKLSQVVGLMRSLKPYVPVSTLKNVYFSLFYSKMTYCLTAWGSAPNS